MAFLEGITRGNVRVREWLRMWHDGQQAGVVGPHTGRIVRAHYARSAYRGDLALSARYG